MSHLEGILKQEETKEETPGGDEESFLNVLKPHQERAEQEQLELILHVFTHAADTWEKDPHLAYETYQMFAKENGSARLYVELYKDRENDAMEYENCLLSFGSYPS